VFFFLAKNIIFFLFWKKMKKRKIKELEQDDKNEGEMDKKIKFFPASLLTRREGQHVKECEICQKCWPLYANDCLKKGVSIDLAAIQWQALEEKKRFRLFKLLKREFKILIKPFLSKRTSPSSYQLFLKSRFENKELSGLKFVEKSKILSKEWISLENKTEFENESKLQKSKLEESYEKLSKYEKQSIRTMIRNKRKDRRNERSLKDVKNGYMSYLADKWNDEVRLNSADKKSYKEIMERSAVEWRGLEENKKDYYRSLPLTNKKQKLSAEPSLVLGTSDNEEDDEGLV
jgi:hypothetical protein